MSYWGSGPDQSDYAFDQTGLAVEVLKDHLFASARNVVRVGHPEQAMVAHLVCIRLLAQEFPATVKVSIWKRDLGAVLSLFDEWSQKVKDVVPESTVSALRSRATEEIALILKLLSGKRD